MHIYTDIKEMFNSALLRSNKLELFLNIYIGGQVIDKTSFKKNEASLILFCKKKGFKSVYNKSVVGHRGVKRM